MRYIMQFQTTFNVSNKIKAFVIEFFFTQLTIQWPGNCFRSILLGKPSLEGFKVKLLPKIGSIM